MNVETNKSNLSVVFDFGGVVLDWNPRHLYASYFSNEQGLEWFLASPFREFNEALDSGMSYDLALAACRHPDNLRHLKIYVDDFPLSFQGEIQGSVQIIEDLKKSNVSLFGLTNWSKYTFPWALKEFPSLQLFDQIVVSGFEGVRKPFAEIYKIAEKKFNRKPSELIFFFYCQENVDGANARGWKAHLFRSPEETRSILERYFDTAN